MTPTCENCKFYLHNSCHKLPPIYSAEIGSFWTIVDRRDWCGEWKHVPLDLPKKSTKLVEMKYEDRTCENCVLELTVYCKRTQPWTQPEHGSPTCGTWDRYPEPEDD